MNGEALALSDPRLGDGWNEVESGEGGAAWRWTNGEAALAIGAGALEVEVAMTARYWVAQPPQAARRA